MQLFLLGAGRPAIGTKPTALKHIALNTKAMDWQLHSFEDCVEMQNVHFLGGYHVDEVNEAYPNLNISFVPDWQNRSVLHSLLSAPFANKEVFCSYSDTIFRKADINRINAIEADLVVGIDSQWKSRFESRTETDIESAETIFVNGKEFEFTGLIKFNEKVALHLTTLVESEVGNDLLDLIQYLADSDFKIKYEDLSGNWAEFNSPEDLSKFILGTKAETLARLKPRVKQSFIASQISFTTLDWKENPEVVLSSILNKYASDNIVVRSSSKGEDNWNSSNAGGFESVLDVDCSNPKHVREAIEQVKDSYGKTSCTEDQILVQPFLSDVKMSGVVFTCGLESGAPYYRFNFDDKTSSTESVTSGLGTDLRTVLISRLKPEILAETTPELFPVLRAVEELELLLGYDKLDIEFAVDKKGLVHIFQVRPVVVNHEHTYVEHEIVEDSLKNCVDLFTRSSSCLDNTYGDRTIYANMPDWNPAEIIGTRPKPLAFSLYRQLITNDVWAQQRAEFGYKDVRPHPLIVSFSGQPYVDSRASFSSFLPKHLSDGASNRIANAYLSILSENPNYHDKIEFDVAFTIWTAGFEEKAKQRLLHYGVLDSDIIELEEGLRSVTKGAFERLEKDTNSIFEMQERKSNITNSCLADIDKAYALLDDCKKFGTLAFSHAARAGFVANTTLNSFVEENIFTEERKLEFLRSFSTVAGDFERDKILTRDNKMSIEQLIEKYGHLRPGTYEVSQQAYWESPEQFFVFETGEPKQDLSFELSNVENKRINDYLEELGANISPESLIKYLKEAIQARESVKFHFTKNLSAALDYIVKWGSSIGINRDDMSYLEFSDIEQYKLNILSVQKINDFLSYRKENYKVTSVVELPPLINNISDFFCFEKFASQPNFVTINRVIGNAAIIDNHDHSDLNGKVAIIPQADPGYDWLFGYNISGLITKYGGANSHMAIRAAEIGLPAAIGVGDKIYEKMAKNNALLELDCANKVLRLI